MFLSMLSGVSILCLSLGNWEGVHRNFLLLQEEGSLGDVWVICKGFFSRVKRKE